MNCIYNKNIIECINKNIERSLFGVGVRFCVEYLDKHKECQLKQSPIKINIINTSSKDVVEE